jgi:predicted alpha/beta hydrolase family esterase
MKNAIIFHGTGCTPESFWHPYLKTELEKKGYDVWVPALPDADSPDINKWLPKALEGSYNSETIIIGHSAGGPLILAVLESLDKPVKMAIQVAGFMDQISERKQLILKSSYDWEKIKNNAKHHILINSDNDPWGCDDKQGRKLFDMLGGSQVILHGEGHMGSDTYNQPYKQFPLLVKLIETYE